MNIALGSAALIRMAKLGCGALGSGFIASHHARADNSAELVARKICPKRRAGPVANVPAHLMSGTLRRCRRRLGRGSEPLAVTKSKSALKQIIVGSPTRLKFIHQTFNLCFSSD